MFSATEVRSLCAARFDMGWVPIDADEIPPTIFQKILEYRSGKLQEVEQRIGEGTTFAHAPRRVAAQPVIEDDQVVRDAHDWVAACDAQRNRRKAGLAKAAILG